MVHGIQSHTSSHQVDLDLNILMNIHENDDLVFSFYLNLEQPSPVAEQISQIIAGIEPGLDLHSQKTLHEATTALNQLVSRKSQKSIKGLAFFYRGGKSEFRQAITFHVPLVPWAFAGTSPNVVPLIELKDTYDRYIVLISTDEQARILEIVLGTVTREAWLERPELRPRVGREWTREHYQNHRRDRGNRFVQEKVNLLQELMSKGGSTHVILAGNPNRIALLKNELPRNLRECIINTHNLDIREPHEKIVRETINSFVEYETNMSSVNLNRLKQTLLSGSGATVGMSTCEMVLLAGVVDTLLVTQTVNINDNLYNACGNVRNKTANKEYMQLEKRREQLLNHAFNEEVPIEFVESDSFLQNCDGVGALLRYRGAEHVAAGVSGLIAPNIFFKV